MLKKVLSILLCSFLMLTAIIPAFAVEGNVTTLKELYFTDLIELNFNKDTLNYEAVFPYNKATNSYYVPELVAVPTDSEATVDIDVPADITAGAITVKVTGSNGEAEQTYHITPRTVGGNLYVDGDFESGLAANQTGSALVKGSGSVWGRPSGTKPVVAMETEDVATGEAAMKVTSMGSDSKWYGLLTEELAAEKTYYTSMQAKLANDAKYNGQEYTSSSKSSSDYLGITRSYTQHYNGDGTKRLKSDGNSNSSVTWYKDQWTTAGIVFVPSAAVNVDAFYHYITNWDNHPDVIVDDCFVGELAVGKIAVTDAAGSNVISFGASDLTADKTIQLSAKALNQYGNPAGLEDMTVSVSGWRMVGNSAGVTVNETGLVTVPASTPAGTYYVEALMDSTDAVTTGQGTVKGVFTVMVSNGSLANLDVSGPSVITLEEGKLNYEVLLPAKHIDGEDVYTMPVVTATPANPAHTVSVTYPGAVTDGAAISVKVKDATGTLADVYTLTLKTVGGNLYVDGSFESGISNWSAHDSGVKLSLSNEGGAVGSKSLEVDYQGKSTARWKGLLKNGGYTLPIDQTYYASFQAKLSSKANKETFTNSLYIRPGTGGSKTYYLGDGTPSTTISLNKSSWATGAAVMLNKNNTDFVGHEALKWDGTDPITLYDDYFIGELVVSEIAVTDSEGNALTAMTRPANGTLDLDAKVLNQFNNVAGLENETVNWSLVNAPSGASITEDGILTIPENFSGDITVKTEVVPTYTGADQKMVKGIATVTVVEPGISYVAGSGEVTSQITLLDKTGTAIDYIVALYEKDINGNLKLLATAPVKSVTIDKAIYQNSQKITVPADGKKYVVKSFIWQQTTLQPVIPAEAWEN